ncbi:MAG: hypothetical protein ACYDCB_10055, partial [Candidatus Dormibacteria bacterium]
QEPTVGLARRRLTAWSTGRSHRHQPVPGARSVELADPALSNALADDGEQVGEFRQQVTDGLGRVVTCVMGVEEVVSVLLSEHLEVVAKPVLAKNDG